MQNKIIILWPIAGFVGFAFVLALAMPGGAHARQASSLPLTDSFDLSEKPGWEEASTQAGEDWLFECVDCPRYFDDLTDHRLALDSNGHPHLVYGGDHLYHAWHDGTSWHTEVVDRSPGVGAFASLVLDESDNPHISYYDATNGDLKYACFDGVAWQIETVDSAGDVGAHTSLALDSAGYPHVTYCALQVEEDEPYCNGLQYAHYDGAAWQTETVDNSERTGRYTSLALDSAERPHVSYEDPRNHNLKYAHHDGTTWTIEAVDDGVYGETSLALDSADHPHISYPGDNHLKYAHHDGTTWVIDTVNGDGGGYQSSLVLDASGRPHISDCDGHNVRYTYYDGATWQIEVIDEAQHLGSGRTSLVLDATGRPHISYYNFGFGMTLDYVHYDGTAWQIETVDHSIMVGLYNSLALDVANWPPISYIDRWPNHDLKYARFDGAAWQVQVADDTLAFDTYYETSLALDTSGLPHVSYAFLDLLYGYYDGSAWQTETVDTGLGWNSDTSLSLDSNNHPHIGYCANDGLRYARYNGTAWITETVDSIGQYCDGISLALDAAGQPHISYADWNQEDLKYATYDGTAWITETVDSTNVSGYTSLALDSAGRPHISYRSYSAVTEGDLKYAYHDGTTWQIETVDSGGDTGRYTSLALNDDDLPRISYVGDDGLEYAYHDGAHWQIEAVSPTANSYNSLALDSAGWPHISYYDTATRDLKYACRPAAVQSLLDPATGGTLVYTDTRGNLTVVHAPAGAVAETTTLAYVPMEGITSPPGFSFTNHAFDLKAHRDGNVLPGFAFQQPVSITIHYSEEDVASMDETTLRLNYWDGSAWVDAAGTCAPSLAYERHPEANWLAVPVCHASRFALFGENGYNVYVPLVVKNR